MENISTNLEETTTITIPAEDAPVPVEETAPVDPINYERLYQNEKKRNKAAFGAGIGIGIGSTVLFFKYREPMRKLAVAKKARRLEKKAKKGNEKAKKKLETLYKINESFLKDLIEDPATY